MQIPEIWFESIEGVNTVTAGWNLLKKIRVLHLFKNIIKSLVFLHSSIYMGFGVWHRTVGPKQTCACLRQRVGRFRRLPSDDDVPARHSVVFG